jgi:hypothetical protein
MDSDRRPPRRLSYANVVSTLALFAVMGGSAYAVSKVGSKDIERNAIASKHIEKAGVKGVDIGPGEIGDTQIAEKAIKGSKLENLTVSELQIAEKAVKQSKIGDKAVGSGQLAEGAVTASKLASGAVVKPGSTLPAGTTLRGVVAPVAVSADVGSAGSGQGVSFGGYTLPSRPNAKIVPVGESGGAPCPGTPAQPEATPGNLCVYVTGYGVNESDADFLSIIDPLSVTPNFNALTYNFATEDFIVSGDAKASRFGFTLSMQTSSNISQPTATWAVNAG